MDWERIERVDAFFKRTEKWLLEAMSCDGIRNWPFYIYMEVEARMKKAEKHLDKGNRNY